MLAGSDWIIVSPSNGVRDRLFRVLSLDVSLDDVPSCSRNEAYRAVVPTSAGVRELGVSLKASWPVVSFGTFFGDPGSIRL